MCGITGFWKFNSPGEFDTALINRMVKSIAHRGPDGEGVYADPELNLALGHRRLSIIDLATGSQPMPDETKQVWIVFNGEIYNFRELRAELEGKGHHFLTNSDTEVILAFYKEYGEAAFYRLNGIFAFAIYDIPKRQLVLARDHFGVKPLYYCLDGKGLLFGSEIKTILQDRQFTRELDLEAFNSFLTFRYNPSPQTLFKGIKKLYPGHYLKIDAGGGTELKSFWDYQPVTNRAIGIRDAIISYQDLFARAVERQMISDVPVGLLLSGGVDSAAIGMLMQQHAAEKIKTFTIGFGGNGDFNELADAKRSAEIIGSDHYEVIIGKEEYLDFFWRSFEYTEEPIAQTSIPALYYVSKLAAEHVKVVMAGQGADEPLAGYPRYLGEKLLANNQTLLSILPLDALSKLLPRNEQLRRLAYSSGIKNELQRFLAIYSIFTPEQKSGLVKPDVLATMPDDNLNLIGRIYKNAESLDGSLNKILFIDTRMSLSDNLLIFGDKMAMASSLEMRVPFLDVELIKFIESLPASYKLKGMTHKFIHKEAVKKWLPKEIIYRKKRGFATPMDNWLQTGLADKARELFNEPGSASGRFFNLPYVNAMLEAHKTGKANFQRNIFSLLSFEIWYRTYFTS